VTPHSRIAWFRRLTLAAFIVCAVVVVLGAWVRLTAAGLGCPDWPTCYGHVTAGQALENVEAANAAFPHRPLEYGKALREMVHRYAATALGFLIVVLAAMAIANRRDGAQPVRGPLFLLVFVVVQGIFGALTVTWQLAPLIVTLHLLGGLTTLAVLWWVWLKPQYRELHPRELALRRVALIALVALVVQIALGGWTSSNYAAIACPDVPTCQDSWWPEMNFRDAFVLWRGLGIDYEGGVLNAPARVAIHFTHRLGAVFATLALATAAFMTISRARSPSLRAAGIFVAIALTLQIGIGIMTVARGFPLGVATAHNAGAALLVLAVVTLLRYLWPLRATWLRGEKRI
jgi:cytochrome c oxidase assembly protein subunit 15